MVIYRPLFGAHGKNFLFDPDGDYSYSTIFVGNDVFLGPKARLSAPRSSIVIGSKVMFGPEVCVMGGNHRTDIIGRFMADVVEEDKRPEDDKGVVIEDDVWIGARSTILHGVRIGRGAIVGAGAVVTRNIPPYAIAGGIPARVLKWRWSIDSILRHEASLYSTERRLTPLELAATRQECSRNAHPVLGAEISGDR